MPIRCSICGAFFEESEHQCPKCGATPEEILEKAAMELKKDLERFVKRKLNAKPAEDGKSVILEWNYFPDDISFVLYHSTDGKTYKKLVEQPRDSFEIIYYTAMFTHEGLSPGQTHYYKVVGKTAKGKKLEPSEPVSVLLEAKRERGFKGLSVDGKSVMLSWNQFPEDTGYIVYHSADGESYEKLAELPVGITFFTHEGLSPGEYHYYKVAAKTAQGEKFFSYDWGTPRVVLVSLEESALEALEALEVLEAKEKREFWAEPSADGKSVILRWEQFPPDEGYVLYHSRNGKNYQKLAELGCVHTAFKHKGLSPGEMHWYKIAAKNRRGKELEPSGTMVVFLEESK